MSETFSVSLDVMGGDHGPKTVLGGADIALMRKPHLRFQLYGDEQAINTELQHYPKLKSASEVHHCDVSISMDEKPSKALRKGRYKSGMWKAIEAVKEGQAQACISAGNTGALMAIGHQLITSAAA